MDQLPQLGKKELFCLLLFTCNYVVSVWRGFLFLWVLGLRYFIMALPEPSIYYFDDDKVNIHGQDVDLETTASGHCCIKLERENRNQSGETWSKGKSVTFCNKLNKKL